MIERKTTKEIVKSNMSLFEGDACKRYDDELVWFSEESVKELLIKLRNKNISPELGRATYNRMLGWNEALEEVEEKLCLGKKE